MLDAFTRDMLSVFNIGLCILVMSLSIRDYRSCTETSGRWVFLVKAVVAFGVGLVFVASLLDLYGGTDRITPEVGRPAYSWLLTALVLSSIFQHRKNNGGCQ